MTRKHTPRRSVIPLPPRGLRPKLAPDQLTDLALAHIVNLDLIAHGRASDEELWQMVGGVLTWSRVADLLATGQDEMQAQLQMATAVVERYGATGCIGFSGVEYQVAKRGTLVMDELAAIVDRHTAVVAANWSEEMINRMAAQHRGRKAA